MSIHYGNPKFDLRTLPRSLREGKTTPKEVDHYLKNLPDEAKKSVELGVGEVAQTPAPPKKSAAKTPTFALANEG